MPLSGPGQGVEPEVALEVHERATAYVAEGLELEALERLAARSKPSTS